MANYVHRQTVGKLIKDLQGTARFMQDMEMFFTKQWKDKGAGRPDESVEQYVIRKEQEEMKKIVFGLVNTVEVLAGNVEQLLNMQTKQHIDIVQVKTRKKRTAPKKQQVSAGDHIDDIVVMYDRKEYMRGKHIGWNTPGFVPRDIAFNEFDIARKNSLILPLEEQFNVFNQREIKARWCTLFLNCRAITGMSLGELIKAYAKSRGLNK